MESFFNLPFSRYNNKVPFPITALLEQIHDSKQEITEMGINQQTGSEDFKVAKAIESLSKGVKPSKQIIENQGTIGAVFKEYFEKKEEKVINDETLEKLISAAQDDFNKESFVNALSSLPKANYNILAYLCLFLKANKSKITGIVASHFFTPLLSNGKKTDKFMSPLIQHSSEIFEGVNMENLICTEEDLALALKPAYNADYVKKIKRRIAKRKNSCIPGASCDLAVAQGLVRPHGRPQEFQNIDHDYEYGEGKEDDEVEEGKLGYKYVEVDGSDYEYEYEYEIEE